MAIVLLVCVVLSMSLFRLKETELVFLVEFGKVVKIIDTPGLHARVPFIQDVVSFDRRVGQVDSPAREVISLEQKRLIIDAYTKYKVIDPKIFFEVLKDSRGAEIRIQSMLDSSMRRVVASFPMSSLLSSERTKIMSSVRDLLKKQTEGFGISILDVRIVRADLPVENSESIFQRMRTEREKEAHELRAQGVEESQIIRSKADRVVRSIVAEAQMNASIIMGNAEAKASKIYASAFSKDPQFFKFYRTMESYTKIFANDRSGIVLSTDNEIFSQLSKDRTPL